MQKAVPLLVLIMLLLSVSITHASKGINLNFQEMPLQSQVCNYLTPQNLRTAYNFLPLYNLSINGNGQAIAIVVAHGDPNLQQDVNAFDSYYGLNPLTNGSNLMIEEPFGSPSSYPVNWTYETALDVEMVHSLAPGAKIYLIVAPNDSWLFQTVNYTVSNVPANTISLSWGSSELEYTSQAINYLNAIFQSAQSNGINVFVASGDTGAYNSYNTPNVNFPASSPNVIAVGGTTLSIYSNGDYKSEVGWNGSGGGQSQFFARPPFQPDISSYRMVPDVAFDAGTPVCVYADSGWIALYGTSLAAPSWAAIDSLINQNLHGDEGYLNSHLYSVFNNVGSLVFNNITSGCNDLYCADGEYNEVTGLGSPKAYQLVEALSNTTYEVYFNDPVNGVFSVNGKNYTTSTTLKFAFGEKVNIAAYSQNISSDTKFLFTDMSGIVNTRDNAISFFVNQSGTINIAFSVYFLVNEYDYNGINNRSEYVKNGSIFNVSAQKLENYSQYQEVLLGFSIDNGTLLQTPDYAITVLSPFNVSFSWNKNPKVAFEFLNGTSGLFANVSYYRTVPLSKTIKKVYSVVSNGSYVYSSNNSDFYIYANPQIIAGNRYIVQNVTSRFQSTIPVNFIKEYNYTINFLSRQGAAIKPSYFYISFENITERYQNYYIWAPRNSKIVIKNASYDGINLKINQSLQTNSQTNLNATIPVSNINIKVVTILGIPVVGAGVTINIDNVSFKNYTNILGGVTFANLPQKTYNATITAYNSKFFFGNLNALSNTLSITAGLYELYIILGVIVIILVILLLVERIRRRKYNKKHK
ncbi:S53 family peptidase [Candidatus Parvarchaeota archaeon]|nr:S53 family peptidase [Candidatus Parvarchaeota archaeon]